MRPTASCGAHMSSSVAVRAHLNGIRLQVTGMTCASCVLRVEKSLKAVPGVKDVGVNLATEVASVNADASVHAEALAAAVRMAGSDVAEHTADDTQSAQGDAKKRVAPWWPVAASAA